MIRRELFHHKGTKDTKRRRTADERGLTRIKRHSKSMNRSNFASIRVHSRSKFWSEARHVPSKSASICVNPRFGFSSCPSCLCGESSLRLASTPSAQQIDRGAQLQQRVIGRLNPVYSRNRIEDDFFLLRGVIFDWGGENHLTQPG